MIINADCTELPDDVLATCDVLITDPPYSPHVHEHATSTRTDGVGPEARDLGFAALTPALRATLARFGASVKRWSVVFSDFEGVHAWREDAADAGLEWIRLVPWVRWSQPQISGDRPCTGAEAVLVFHAMTPPNSKGRRKPIAKTWNGHGGLTHFGAKALRGSDKHPTEKPLDLALSLVSYFSAPGEVVLDPCTGRGTIPLACRLLGREAIGLELDEREAGLAAYRETAGLTPRDLQRCKDWLTASADDFVPTPTKDSERATHERFLRRRADRETLRKALGL